MDWDALREKIAAQGMRNSNVIALAPTATISNIIGTSPCIEPIYKNLFAKSNLSGDFVVLNPFLVRDLKDLGLWNRELAEELKAQRRRPQRDRLDPGRAQGPLPHGLPDRPTRADRRGGAPAEVDRPVPVAEPVFAAPDLKAMSHMYRHAWHAGLKTTYYLRTLGASTIEKSTVQAAAAAAAPAPTAAAARRARSTRAAPARNARPASDGIGKASGMTEHAHPQAQQTKETLGVFRGSLMPTSRRFPWPAFFTI